VLSALHVQEAIKYYGQQQCSIQHVDMLGVQLMGRIWLYFGLSYHDGTKFVR